MRAITGTRSSAEPAQGFHFIAIGDMPYGLTDGQEPAPEYLAQFDRLIAFVNRRQPAFTVHLGDIKDGSIKLPDGTEKHHIPCTECYHRIIRQRFDRFTHPLVYTPGDNETSDCLSQDGLPPAQALQAVRQVFFDDILTRKQNRALGLVSQQQSAEPQFRPYVENLRWWRGAILFATLNVVGNNDNRPDGKSGAKEEHKARSAAARAWLEETFAQGLSGGASGMVLLMQADPWRPPGHKRSKSGYKKLLEALEAHLAGFDKPVLLVHGDGHCYCTELPGDIPLPKPVRRWLRRVQVFGENALHAVRIDVHPGATGSDMFRPTALEIPGNPNFDPQSHCPRYKGKYRKTCGYG
jgi:hypothetical protein